MTIDRRTFLKTGAVLGAAALCAPAIAQQRAKVKLGYLHTLAVDGQIWTGIDRGSFAKHMVEFEPVQFTTGLELFQAMIGGSIDMLATGAVISNFPARGQGRMFLVNNVEFATAQLWVREDMGVKSIVPVTYINSSAAIKAFCGEHGGIVCTSTNAQAIMKWAWEHGEKLLMLPDDGHDRDDRGRAVLLERPAPRVSACLPGCSPARRARTCRTPGRSSPGRTHPPRSAPSPSDPPA